jgi:cell division protein FtsW
MKNVPDTPRKEKTAHRMPIFLSGKMDLTFLVIVLVLLSIGLIMMFSASYAVAYYYEGDSLHYIARQLPIAIIGVGVMLAASKFNYQYYRKIAWIVYIASLALLLVALFMPEVKGTHRWIFIGSVNFQPSEIAKFAVVLLFSNLILRFGPARMRTTKYGIVPFLILLAPIVVLMVKEPHLSGTILILALAAIMMFVGGTHPAWFVVGAGVVAAAVFVVIINPDILTVLAKYAGTRIEVWLDPFADPLDTGYQTVQSLYAIGSGGLMGTGIGGSRQKYLYLPEPYNDFVFSVCCEELGFVGATLIICIFALLVWRGFVIAARCRDRFGSLLATGLTAQVGIQAILNIAVVTNTIPNTGISLPFFSYGGTSLLMLLGEMGIVLSVSRNAAIEKE